MHAFLIVGDNIQTKEYSQKLVQKLKVKVFEFSLTKIADTRELKNITKLSFNDSTAVIIYSIDEITEEAGNAFLKNLEEPQENIYYILTASNIKRVLPTIVSRCEVVKLKNIIKTEFDKNMVNFLSYPTDKKLMVIDKIKDRQEAKKFVEDLIDILHFNLLNKDENKTTTVSDLEILLKTLNNLKLNGNVGLQLANMAINLN